MANPTQQIESTSPFQVNLFPQKKESSLPLIAPNDTSKSSNEGPLFSSLNKDKGGGLFNQNMTETKGGLFPSTKNQ